VGQFTTVSGVFKMQKRLLRIMNNVRHRNSCRQLLKNWGILQFYSQYVFSLMMFVVKNMYSYITNQEIHGVNTRQNTDIHLISVRLTAFEEGTFSLEWEYLIIFPQMQSN
jgi:hypothetical protein